MDQNTFVRFMSSVKVCFGMTDYAHGYGYGLRRFYHGPRFGEDAQIERMQARGGALQQGLADGLAGMQSRLYCSQNDGDCASCSLVNYGKDCRNNPVDAQAAAEQRELTGFEKIAVAERERGGRWRETTNR
jgi:hypothetical protein